MPTSKLLQFLIPALFNSYVTDPGDGGEPKPDQKPDQKPDADINKTFSYDYVKELREENKALRLKAQASEKLAEESKTGAEAAKKTADESVKTATNTANERIIRAELKAAAITAGMIDLDGLKLADLSKVKLKDDGTVEGADTMLADLKTAKAYLFGTPNTSSQKDPTPPATPPVAKKAKDMTDPEYEAAKKDFLK